MKKFTFVCMLAFIMCLFGCSSTGSDKARSSTWDKSPHASKAYKNVRPYNPNWRLKEGEKPQPKKKVVIRFQEDKSNAWTREEDAVKNMSEKNLLDRPFIETWPKPKPVKKVERSFEKKEKKKKADFKKLEKKLKKALEEKGKKSKEV
jgi:hypothetical protein